MDNWGLQGASCENAKQSIGGQYIPPTARQQLLQKRDILQGKMDRITAALAALDAHPDLEAFTETLKAALR